MKPARGLRFIHRHWLDEAGDPLTCVVTRVAKGIVYYRPDYGTRLDGSPWRGAPSYVPVEAFDRYARELDSHLRDTCAIFAYTRTPCDRCR
jgi:hypothetical protein